MHEMAVRLRMADGEIHALVEKFVAEPQAA